MALGQRVALVGSLCVLLVAGTAGATAPQASGTLEGSVQHDRGIDTESIVIWLERPGAAPLVTSGVVEVDQKGLAFVPALVVVQAGTTVRFRNGDTVPHSVFAPHFSAEPFNLGTWSAGEVREHRFHSPGVSVVLCSVHPEMEAFVVVTPSPWMARLGAGVDFRIDSVPDGEYRVVAWHPLASGEARVRIRAGEMTRVSLRLTGPQ